MDTTNRPLAYLGQRIGATSLVVMVLVAVTIAVVAGLAFLAVSELLAAAAEPVQVAPVRWFGRF